MKRNERDWAGQLISWIQNTIHNGKTIFEDATNDTGIKLASGSTKFPDILLFTDKTAGIIFNGWELKFPDTRVDDMDMLTNALEKAERLQSDSFVTWNGAEAIIWKINDEAYNLDSLSKIKEYPKELSINSRDDLADPVKYNLHEPLLRKRASLILHDLEQLLVNQELKPAINITGNIINSITKASNIILPKFQETITIEKGKNASFRREFNRWKIYESSTLKILSSSSRRPEHLIEEEVLAKFAFYNLIGKILFYLTLSENLSKKLNRIEINNPEDLQSSLNEYFNAAQQLNYQVIFQPYFTDEIPFDEVVNETLLQLIHKFTEFDFRILPSQVIGTILENLVPTSEKQKFGQYFTSETLANLVTFPAIQTCNDFVYDPTSGAGTFLNSFYKVLKYHGTSNHTALLNQIWGNDISHFPAILSVINLYKQDISNTENFPRITRDDFFNIEHTDTLVFPSSNNDETSEYPIPEFDVIASNFPFVQQEDIPNEELSLQFRELYGEEQSAFLQNNRFKINERSDYFTYCIYNSVRFLKDGGYLAAITSNAWLGKEYGLQFKRFILDNFHIKYIVRSTAEHWFSDSKVSTVYMVFEKTKNHEETRFVSFNFKLGDEFDQENIEKQLSQMEAMYAEIDLCDDKRNKSWINNNLFDDLFHKNDNSLDVCIVPRKKLWESIDAKENWSNFFISTNIFAGFEEHLTKLYPDTIESFRGERTGWNEMFILTNEEAKNTGIEPDFLIPYVKSPAELTTLEFSKNYRYQLFVCSFPMDVLKVNYPGAYGWIKRFENARNKNGTKTIQEACAGHKPYWYTLRPKKAHIVTAINPYERFFFCYSLGEYTIDQRLVAIKVKEEFNVELIVALLNSVITFLHMEMRGTSRSLGALDLNANYFKNLKVLNPNALSDEQVNDILRTFSPLKQRNTSTIFEEVKKTDRMNFDKTVLRCYGIDESTLDSLYEMLLTSVENRVSMMKK